MSGEALDLRQQLLRAMSAEQKIRVSEMLRRSAWDLKAAWFRRRHPSWTEVELQAAVNRWFRDAGT